MHIDPRLNDIDDCLYRVAVRALIIRAGRVLLVQEKEKWWAFPGGGVDHGETAESTLVREIEEELGIPAKDVLSDFQIVHYTLGQVVNDIPRMNLFFKVTIPQTPLQPTAHITDFAWFDKEAFLEADLRASYNKAALADAVFG